MDTEELLEAIRRYYHDTSRSRLETMQGLEDAQEEIAELINTLEEEGGL